MSLVRIAARAGALPRSSQDQGRAADVRQGHLAPAPPPRHPSPRRALASSRTSRAQIFATVCPPRPIRRGQPVNRP